MIEENYSRREIYSGVNIGDFEEKLKKQGGREVPTDDESHKIYHMTHNGCALIDYYCKGNSLRVTAQGRNKDVQRLEEFVLGLANTKLNATLF